MLRSAVHCNCSNQPCEPVICFPNSYCFWFSWVTWYFGIANIGTQVPFSDDFSYQASGGLKRAPATTLNRSAPKRFCCSIGRNRTVVLRAKRPWLSYIVWFTALLLIAASLFPILESNRWWIRILTFPQAQITALLLLVMVAALAILNLRHSSSKLLIASLAGTIVYQLQYLLSYSRFPERRWQRPRGAHLSDKCGCWFSTC